MSVASAVILASAIKPRESAPAGSGKETIGESIAKRPLQWLIVGAAVAYVASKALKGVIKTGGETRTEGAETGSENNPFAFNNFLDWSKVPANTKVLTYQDALARARQIYNALDVVAYENEDIVVGVFTSLPSKIQVAQVAKAFADNFGKDILTYIKDGNKTFNFWTSGLSDANYQRVIDNVARKPKF
jgi:hypothetical protein